MKLHKILVVAMCAALPAIAYSDDDKVLKGREITESALIDALTPEAGATQTRRMRTSRCRRRTAPAEPMTEVW